MFTREYFVISLLEEETGDNHKQLTNALEKSPFPYPWPPGIYIPPGYEKKPLTNIEVMGLWDAGKTTVLGEFDKDTFPGRSTITRLEKPGDNLTLGTRYGKLEMFDLENMLLTSRKVLESRTNIQWGRDIFLKG